MWLGAAPKPQPTHRCKEGCARGPDEEEELGDGAGTLTTMDVEKGQVLDPRTGIPEPNVKRGLTAHEVQQLREAYGANVIEVYVEPWWILLANQFMMPMSFMLEVAMVISGAAEEWSDFSVITLMLFVNSLLGFSEEMKARASVEQLKKKTVSMVQVVRDGNVVALEPRDLVPQDVIYIRAGDAVPADLVYASGSDVKVNTSALTGESIPRKYGKSVKHCGVDENGNAMQPGSGEEAYDKYIGQGCTIQEGTGTYCYVKRTGTGLSCCWLACGCK